MPLWSATLNKFVRGDVVSLESGGVLADGVPVRADGTWAANAEEFSTAVLDVLLDDIELAVDGDITLAVTIDGTAISGSPFTYGAGPLRHVIGPGELGAALSVAIAFGQAGSTLGARTLTTNGANSVIRFTETVAASGLQVALAHPSPATDTPFLPNRRLKVTVAGSLLQVTLPTDDLGNLYLTANALATRLNALDDLPATVDVPSGMGLSVVLGEALYSAGVLVSHPMAGAIATVSGTITATLTGK